MPRGWMSREAEMEISCFFCQNLLSDFVEGIVPSSRHSELQHHLESCLECKEILADLKVTLKCLSQMALRGPSHEMGFQILEAAEAGKRRHHSSRRVSRWVLAVAVPLCLLMALVFSFRGDLPWVSDLFHSNDPSQFVRYYPLLQGATEILEEQGAWLHLPAAMGSLWEEGGLSPEEFEKTFQLNRGK